MHSLVVFSLLSLVTLRADDTSHIDQKGPAWLKDYAQAKAKALSEKKPIFAVFR
jgi:hypothetical protein